MVGAGPVSNLKGDPVPNTIKRERTLTVRVTADELAAYKAALPALRRQSGEHWNLSRVVREGARRLSDLAGEGVPPRGERGGAA